ncbi:hypothetical protein Hanom_Chr17g01531221 [Helianthus anomalus]
METLQEIKARDTSLAQHLMTELWVMLEQDKANINLDHMERGKAPIENYSEDLTMRSQLEKTKICDIISKLQHIEGVLTKLPTSDRAKMQSSFSSLCAEANLVMKKIDRKDVQCGTLGRRLSVYSDELAKALQRSSKQI